jgi:hypothetical protein
MPRTFSMTNSSLQSNGSLKALKMVTISIRRSWLQRWCWSRPYVHPSILLWWY